MASVVHEFVEVLYISVYLLAVSISLRDPVTTIKFSPMEQHEWPWRAYDIFAFDSNLKLKESPGMGTISFIWNMLSGSWLKSPPPTMKTLVFTRPTWIAWKL